jgi:hypothetical protein|tara:strand:- start:343 stop:882 length:540 start_codon:yes stop_codon:yes gene_type:complete
MKRIKIVALSTAALLLSTTALAGEGFSPDEAFQTMLKLEGTWTGEAQVVQLGQDREAATVSTTTVSFKNIGNSSVMQTFAAGTPSEMISMYHQDGKNELIHTHYCAIGNQPSMTFASTGQEGVIDFKFTKGTNMDVDADYHAHASNMRIIDANTYETRTENWGGGKLMSHRYTTMKRVK